MREARRSESSIKRDTLVNARRCGSYEDVASEYYDGERHPTAANFRNASALLLEAWLPAAFPQDGEIVEVGAGRSLLAEQLHDVGMPMDSLTLTDASEVMLDYSRVWERYGARIEVADAASLPIEDGTVALLVSILGDPYNTPAFWREVARVLRPDGTCLFTTPSHRWSEAFRAQAEEPPLCAEFVVGGGPVLVPSFIYPVEEQTRLIEDAGLHVADVSEVRLSQLSKGALSPKITRSINGNDSVVTGYRMVR